MDEPIAEQPSQPLTAAQTKLIHDAKLKNFREKTAACYLYGSTAQILGMGSDTEIFESYVKELLVDTKAIDDPIERMLVEQIALAHHNIGRLHIRASLSQGIDEIKVYNESVTRLLGEFRRLVLALREYKTPNAKHQTTVVQQNVTTGDQQIAYVEAGGKTSPTKNISPQSELVSNERITHARNPNVIPESAAGGSREAEPIEAKRTVGERTSQASSGGDEESTLAEINRPTNGNRESEIGGKRKMFTH